MKQLLLKQLILGRAFLGLGDHPCWQRRCGGGAAQAVEAGARGSWPHSIQSGHREMNAGAQQDFSFPFLRSQGWQLAQDGAADIQDGSPM